MFSINSQKERFMKLKYIIPSFMAVVAMLVGCNEDYEAAHLDDLRVSSSFLALSQDGSSTNLVVNAAANWEFQNVPDWLTITPLTGSAGETKVVVSAGAAVSARTATIKLVSGGLVQEINVAQGVKTVEVATCKQVIDGADGKTYRVKGTVTSIANTTYGNWYLDDGTGQIYIYGTLDKNGGTKNFLSLGIEVGDVVTVEGPKTTYNGTVELVDVSVVEIEKSIVKIVEPEGAAEIKKEGGDFTVKLAFKGNLMPTVPDDCSWIRYKTTTVTKGTVTAVTPNPADTAYVKFTVDANEGAVRTSVITFACSSETAASKVTLTVKQKGIDNPPSGTGTKADPFNVPGIVQYVKSLGADVVSPIDVYVKGKISSVKYTYSAQFGTATYNISADGKEEDVFTVYGSYFFDNKPWEEGQTQIKVGDEVVVCGKVIYYKGTTPEYANKKNWLVSLNGKTSEGGTDAPGSLAKPFTPAEANAFCMTLGEGKTSEDDYYVKGKIVSYASNGEFGTQYGNASFYISVDGAEASEKFYVFRTLYLGNVKYSDDSWKKPAVGDEVVICGKLTLYKDAKNGNVLVPETAANKSYLYSLNGKTK